MVGGLKPYPEYRESDVSWLGRIPAHWEVRRNARLFAERNETGFPDLPILEVSIRTGVTVRDLSEQKRKQMMTDRSKYKRAVHGDIAYNMMRMWQGAVGVAPTDGLISPAYVVAKPLPEAQTRYYAYLFRTRAYMNEVNKYSRGIVTDRNRLYWDEFRQMPSVFPPPEEQTAIADFLDSHAELVSRFIRGKRRQLELLEELFASTASVKLQGLGSPEIRATGLSWAPSVSAAYSVLPLKQVVGFQEGPGIMAADFRESGTPLLRIACITGDDASLIGCDYLDPDMVARRWAHFAVRPGDYLLSGSATFGIIARATPEVIGSIPYTGIIRLWPCATICMEYVKYFMRSRLFLDQLESFKSGVGLQHFGPTHLNRMLIPLPPYQLQGEIVAELTKVKQQITESQRIITRQIELAREHRMRLISQLVAGRFDVRTVRVDPVSSLEKAAIDEEDGYDELADDEPEEIAVGDE